MIEVSPLWGLASYFLHLAGAAACALGIVWLSRRPIAKRRDRTATYGALALTALWATIVAAFGETSYSAQLAEAARNLAWLLVLYRLFAHDGRDQSIAGVRPVVLALAFVEALQPALLFVGANWAITTELQQTTAQIAAMFHILVAVGALVLLHNLYGGASRDTRDALRWSAAGLAGFWAFELNFYVVAYLAGSASFAFAALRGLVVGLMVAPVVAGASNSLAGRKLQASHAMAFRTLSLLVIGGYILAMVGAAELLSLLDGNIGRLAQIGFLVGAVIVTLLWLPSDHMRGWVRVTLLKHLFQHRYDYREAWMHLTQTIGQSDGGSSSFYERTAKSMANAIDCPGAMLYLPGENGHLSETARWNWPAASAEIADLPVDFTVQLERDDFVVELDQVRDEKAAKSVALPKSLIEDDKAWVLVPLMHFDRLAGAILLARPSIPRALDWEDFDLLKVVARQLASYLAEHDGQRALMESAQFDDFNRRMAFVMHDIKNLASQLSLLSRNAEKHAEKPAFRKDMLLTLRSSADKLNQLLARLGRYGTGGSVELVQTDLLTLGRNIVRRFENEHPVALSRCESCRVLADREGLEQAIVHLVQNAIDASEPGMPVSLDISTDGLHGRVEIIDSGCGMDPEFIRHRLFKPFVSSKEGGFGIGALEARELVRAMGGRLDVQSREGIGTRFSISIPLVDAAKFITPNSDQEAA